MKCLVVKYSAETPFLLEEADQEAVEIITEHGETLEVIPFVRGMQASDRLKLSLIRKVSPNGIFLPKRGWIPTVPNSFGLPPGETCPGKTEFCESCYAFGSIRSKGVKEMLNGNYELLKSLETEEDMTVYLIEMLQRCSDFADSDGVAPEDRVFRIHWSGDFYSVEYARAWANAVQKFPDINFWVYTRSFREPVDVIPIIDGIENLSILLSVDDGNINDIPEEYDHLDRANSAVDVINAERLVRKDRKTIVCPENLNRLELMQDSQGACIKCRACFDRHVDITFITSGKYDSRPLIRSARDVEERLAEVPDVPVVINRDRYITWQRTL